MLATLESIRRPIDEVLSRTHDQVRGIKWLTSDAKREQDLKYINRLVPFAWVATLVSEMVVRNIDHRVNVLHPRELFHPRFKVQIIHKIQTLPPNAAEWEAKQERNGLDIRKLKKGGHPLASWPSKLLRKISFDEAPTIFDMLVNPDLALIGTAYVSTNEWKKYFCESETNTLSEDKKKLIDYWNQGVRSGRISLPFFKGRSEMDINRQVMFDRFYCENATPKGDRNMAFRFIFEALKLTGS